MFLLFISSNNEMWICVLCGFSGCLDYVDMGMNVDICNNMLKCVFNVQILWRREYQMYLCKLCLVEIDFVISVYLFILLNSIITSSKIMDVKDYVH